VHQDPLWFGCPGSGSALLWLSWIRIRIGLAARIRIRIGLAVLDPDPHWFGCPGYGSILGMRIRIQEHGN
jgi:hypothetical protein